MKRTISLFIILNILGIMLVPGPDYNNVCARENSNYAKPSTTSIENNSDNLNNYDYEDGTVLVTIASKNETNLTKQGTYSVDKNIEIKDTHSFGSASTLGKTKEEEDFLSDKNLTISEVHSDKYSTEELIKKLEKKSDVINVEPNYYQYLLSNDVDFTAGQWGLGGKTIFGNHIGINHKSISKKSNKKTPVVAIVDTGVNYQHEDLAGKIWQNTTNSISVPGLHGYDFGNNDTDPMDDNENSHGTHIAGIIAASHNQKGINGVATDVSIMPLKVFNSSGKSANSYIISAFQYIYDAMCAGVNVKAINCSWGGGPSTETIRNLIEKIGKKGALFVFASGNSGVNRNNDKSTCPYDMSNKYTVIVGASTCDDLPASFSDYGLPVDVFAPGSQIISCVNKYVFSPAHYSSAYRSKICSYFDTCQNENELYCPLLLGSYDGSVPIVTKGHSSFDFFGNEKSGSTIITPLTSSEDGKIYLFIDVTNLNLTENAVYHACADIATENTNTSNEVMLDWNHFTTTSTSKSFIHYKGRTYFNFLSIKGKFTKGKNYYIDNIGISAQNVQYTEFGSYNYSNGTSMACPFATGVIASLANAFPNDTSFQRKERLLKCVRYVDKLSGYCKTSGILDMSKISSSTVTPLVKVKKIKLNKKKATLLYKHKLKLKAKITPSNAYNKSIKWSTSKSKYASVSKKGVVKPKKKGIGHTVKIYAKAKDGSGKKAYCKVKIKSNKKKKKK